MKTSLDHLERSAKRAQFRVVGAKGNNSIQRAESNRAARRSNLPPRTMTPQILLYRSVVQELADLIEGFDSIQRDEFFHNMRFMRLLGLQPDDVTPSMRYTPETITRWMNGSRCPHPEMRQYVLDKCIELLLEKANADPPVEFLRNEDLTANSVARPQEL